MKNQAAANNSRSSQEIELPTSPRNGSEVELNVQERLAYLREKFSPLSDEPIEKHVDKQPITKQGLTWKVFIRRAIKSVASLALVVVLVWVPVQRLLQTTSVEAVVNARLVTLRAPIDGTVASASEGIGVGVEITPGSELLRISNIRADSTRLDDIKRQVRSAEIEQATLGTEISDLKSVRLDLVGQTELFRKGRIEQLQARINGSNSDLAAANLRQQETAAALERAISLESKGFQTTAALDKARRDDEIAAHVAKSIEQGSKAAEVEIESARAGTFLGDSYNDRPRSSQRSDELQVQILGASAKLFENQLRLSQLRDDLTAEQHRYDLMAEAKVLAPSSGIVWELLTAPGEQVQRGQELVRMLDCKAALVTAVVSESVYNRLQVGTTATFRLTEGGTPMVGRIVSLTGMASAPANFAITPSSLNKESYRVAVSVPDLPADANGCSLGRTGQVVFDGKVPPEVARAALQP